MAERFSVVIGEGGAPRVEKRGDADALAREAAALAAVAGRPWAPALIRHEPGLLVTARIPGGARDLARFGRDDALRLGAVLREVHGVRDAPAGVAAYRARRAVDAARALAGTPDAGLAGRLARWPVADGPLAFLHGDLVAANVLWPPGGGPVLIDWEFHRMGDPAEDLAYLAELNALPGAALDAVLEGYDAGGMAARVEAWRGLVAADAAGWYLAHGMPDAAAPLLARARELATRE